jgi:predicted DNA-binding transcriptional regulator AlpA
MKYLRYLRYADLEACGIVNNRVNLQNWIRKYGFPPGQMIGPNTRLWAEADVKAWLASRPTAKKPVPKSPGRPRKVRDETETEQAA